MQNPLRLSLAAAAALLLVATPAAAQQPGLMSDLTRDVKGVQDKLVALAREMPADKLDWRPAEGVRSVREVFLHVAADNYFLPSVTGVQPDASTGIDVTDFATLTTYEKQALDRDATVAALEKSFAHLLAAMTTAHDSTLDRSVKLFGQDMTMRYVWLLTATHLHEHLGQAIAYARSNGVVPPWSRRPGS